MASTFSIRDRQRSVFEAIINTPPEPEPPREWKILVCDDATRTILANLFTPLKLRSFGVSVNTLIQKPRGPIPDVPAFYLINASSPNISHLAQDLSASKPMYQSVHVAFLASVSSTVLSALAAKIPVPSPISTVRDLHSRFISLEQNLFTLNIDKSYSIAVRAERNEAIMRDYVEHIVDGLFSVLVTIAAIPIIRCPRGGTAQAIASVLDARIRDNLDLFQKAPLSSRALSFRRPVLFLVDRAVDITPVLYHTWTYQALVHDCLSMKLDRVSVSAQTNDSQPPAPPKEYTLDKQTDSFWSNNASSPFPVVAQAVETALTKYRSDVEAINKRASSKRSDENTNSSLGTSNLADAISSLPELTREKETIDKHTNIATSLLHNINTRSLDTFFELESQLIAEAHAPSSSQSPDAYKPAIVQLLEGGPEPVGHEPRRAGSPLDRLRLFLIFYNIYGSQISETDMQEYRRLLEEAGADVSVVDHVQQVKGFHHEAGVKSSPSKGTLNTAKIKGLMKHMVNRGYRSITNVAQSAKKLVMNEKATFAVARMLEVYLKQTARDSDTAFSASVLEDHLFFDPKVMPSSDVLTSSVAFPASSVPIRDDSLSARRKMQNMLFSDAIVFAIGGGNYIEFENCVEMIGGNLSSESAPRVLYGATEMVTAESFLSQMKNLQSESS